MQTTAAFSLDRTLAVLTRTPASLDALLRGQLDFWVHQNEGEGTWTAFDIVGHLIFADRTDWMPRLRRILEHGEQVPFEPFDRMGHVRESQGKTLDQLLAEFAQVRRQSIAQLQSLRLQPTDLQKRGRHPALGTVTASELLATWAAHDLNHLHQLARVMACQYRDAVGLFNAYLGVMHGGGHSAP
jgi:hypothetical protein